MGDELLFTDDSDEACDTAGTASVVTGSVFTDTGKDVWGDFTGLG